MRVYKYVECDNKILFYTCVCVLESLIYKCYLIISYLMA